MNDAAALHTLIVPAADDPAVADQHRADWNAAFAQPDPRFVYYALEKVIDNASLALMTELATKSSLAKRGAPPDSVP